MNVKYDLTMSLIYREAETIYYTKTDLETTKYDVDVSGASREKVIRELKSLIFLLGGKDVG